VIDTNTPKLAFEEPQQQNDGRLLWLRTNKVPLHDREGNVIGILGTYDDITARKQDEEALAHYAAELERSNQDLEHFAYVASHDLQEPLRMVASYVQVLAEDYQGKLDPAADEYIGYAVRGAKHMQQLIQDLLAYSRVSTLGKPFEPTDCQAVLEGALDSLRIAMVETGAMITADRLPVVKSDRSQLDQVFLNLVGNALKYHSSATPRVHIGVKPIVAEHTGEPAQWLFSVCDNGIGIEAQYYEKIFVIFQRLHGRTEYAGTGLGLAICRRIIERHHGRIWVESEPGHGSTFYFTLPA
jgi:chemotaxis family two-component system sensor kinase Cph1